jgi:TP901 family phage tail tape measure protein
MAEIAKGIIDIEINTGSAASQLQALQAQINAFNLALNKSNKAQGTFASEYSRELQGAINKTGLFTAETIRLQTAAATLDKTLSKGKTSLGQFFSAKFNKDSAIAAETMALASERAKRLQTQFIATAGAANGFQDALAVRPLAAFSSEAAVAAQRTQILSNMFKQGTTQLINFGKNVQWAGRQLMVGFTVPLTIFGAVAGKTFMELEKQAVAFKKVYGDIFTTPAELNKNLEAVKGLASEYTKYGIAVKDTISLAAQAAAAGRKDADLTDAVSQATRLATLGQMDQNAALETTISLQSAFRLSGKDLADTINFLNMVENQTVVSLQDISAAIPRVAPVIQGLGGDVKDLTVFLAAMQEGGVDAAEGANALKSGLASLINPTKQATEMLNGMGINLETIIQANRGDLMGTVRSFAEALQGLDQFSRQQALEQVFGKFQYAKLGALFENISREGSQAQQVIATMGYTTEQLGATADKELKTIEESFGVQLTGAVERFKLAIAPIGEIFVRLAIPLVNFATKIVESFNGLSDGQKRFAAIAAVIVGVVIPAVTMMAGLFLNLVGTLAKIGQGMALFGKGFITGGPVGAMKALTQSSKYLSLAEMDAAMAAQQLSGASKILNSTLIEQAITGNAAAAAINNLTRAYSAMAATQGAASNLPAFGVAGAAGAAAKSGGSGGISIRRLRRNAGGGVPGSGNTDTVPAMLTPGEFVINKEATKNNLGLLEAINDGKTQGLNKGGIANGVQYLNRGAIVSQARSILDMIRRNNGKIGTLDDFLMSPTVSNDVKKRLSRHASISRSGGFPSSKTQLSPTIKRSTEKTHFGDKQQVLSLEELGLILGTKGGSKRKIAEALIKGGIPVQSLTDDWILLPKSINQAARSNTTSPMNISSAIKELRSNVGAVKFKDRKKDSAFSVLNPNETSSSFVEKMIKELEGYNGDALITDDILTLARNRAYPNMSGAGRSTGIRLPNKSEVGTLAGVDVNSPSFTKAVNEYFKQNNIPLSTDLIVPQKSGSNNWWALQLLDAVGGNVTKVKNKFASSTGFNAGGPVPGSGNTDTVPAMLTPGEFVINKKAASQNQGILEMMNGGQVKGYALGGLVAGATKLATSRTGKFVGGTAASIGGYEAGSALTGGSMFGGLAGSIITPLLPKAATAAAAAMGVSTAAFMGVAAPLALAGFAIYKLNKQIGDAEKSGAEFTKAMYGTSKTIEGIAEQFGTQTNAQAARIAAVERIGGQAISQEAQQKSAQFVESDAGKQMLKDVGTVKAGGGNAVEALKNQLSAAIISGAIGTEEARAIAVEVGTALGDQSIAVGVSGELTRLMGPDGGDLLKNLSSITAEISPKIDANKLAADASSAYEKMNVGEKFIQSFQGGEADFVKNYQLNEVSAANSAAFAKETQARELLNLAYQEGTISLKEFQAQSSAITKSSEDNQDLAAKALGFQNQSALVTASQGTVVSGGRVGGSTVRTEEQKQAKAVLDAQKSEIEKMLLEIPGQTEDTVAKISASISKLGAGAFGDILSGRLNLADVEILVKLKDGGLTEKEIEGVNDKLQALKIIPDINTLINVKTTSQGEITRLYDALVKFEEMPDKELGIYAKDNFTSIIQQAGATYDQFAALPDIQKRIVLAKMEVLAEVRLTLNGNMDMDQGSRADYANQVSTLIQSITSSFTAGATTGSGSGSGSGAGSGGGSGKQTLAEYIKEFKAATKAKMDFFKATNHLLGTQKQEALALIDTAMYLKANAAQRKTLLALAEKQLKIQRATAFLAMTAEEKTLLSLEMQEKALDVKSQADNKALRGKQREMELNNRALDDLAEKEEAVNEKYDEKLEALDKIATANDRLSEQERSRIGLASALASGDIAAAASAVSEIQQAEAQYQIEDARTALEAQRQRDLEALTVSVNGQLLTREQIQTRNKNLANEIKTIEDRLYAVETERLALAEKRASAELRTYLLQQKQTIEALKYKEINGELTKAQKAFLGTLTLDFNNLAKTYNASTPGTRGDFAMQNRGGYIARMANGGVAYKGSREAPPALRMNNGFTVPGIGMTDKVPALLTPGEFVVRKSVADKSRGFLEALNGQVFPGMGGAPSVPTNNFLDGIGSPRYSIPESGTSNIPVASTNVVSTSAPMYNSTYNVNVNVSGTNASPDDIANVVMAKLSQQNRGNLRSTRY